VNDGRNDLSVIRQAKRRHRNRTDFVYVSPIFTLIVQTFVQHGDDVNEILAVIVGKTEDVGPRGQGTD
jgi:hypothetical protein